MRPLPAPDFPELFAPLTPDCSALFIADCFSVRRYLLGMRVASDTTADDTVSCSVSRPETAEDPAEVSARVFTTRKRL